MKKNFFKKLSFVLALAMIISTITPAAGALAATKAPKLNATKVYLHLDTKSTNEYDFNVSNKVSGWKYKWTSKNADVASVESNGLVTAEGVGTTTVSVAISNKGEAVKTLKATVVVRDNIKTLTITNKPAGDKLAVGKANDFNRSFVTASGSTKKTSGVTRWSVKEEGATITDSGVFTATKAGEYTITANAFQSTAKYTSWLADSTKYASYVTATATYTVKVAASMVKAEQVDVDTFKVTFDSAVTDASTKLSVYSLVGTTQVSQLVKAVTMDADNKVATVDLYVPFTTGSTILVKYTDMADVQFVSATTKVEDVASVGIVTKTIELGGLRDVTIALYNKAGVNIATSDLLSRVEINSSSLNTYKQNLKLQMYTVGSTTTLTATFHTYAYDYTTGQEVGALTASQVLTCVDKSTAAIGNINAYTVITALTGTADADFTNAKHTVPALEGGLKLYVQLKGKMADGTTDLFTENDEAGVSANFTFESSNPDVVIVDPANGSVFPAKEGSAQIMIKYNSVYVGSVVITVGAKKAIGSIKLDSNQFNLSNDVDVRDVKSIGLTVKDQLGNDYSNYTVDVTTKGTPVGASSTVYKNFTGGSFNFQGSTGTGTAFTKGTYSYEIAVTDTNDTSKVFKSWVQVTLLEPVDQNVHYYRLEADKDTYDMKLTSSDQSENVTLSLFGYASNGVRNVRVDIDNTPGYTVTVNKPNNGTAVATTAATNGTDTEFALVSVSGGVANGAINKMDKGTYTATATSVTDGVINTTSFLVTDTQPAAVLTMKKLYTAEATPLLAVQDTIKVTIDGNEKTITGYAFNQAPTVLTHEIQASVKEVYVVETYTVNGIVGTLTYTVPVNQTIHYNYTN